MKTHDWEDVMDLLERKMADVEDRDDPPTRAYVALLLSLRHLAGSAASFEKHLENPPEDERKESQPQVEHKCVEAHHLRLVDATEKVRP